MRKIIKIISYLRYLPAIIFKIRNWPVFLLNYAHLRNTAAEYIFRNGLRIKTFDSVSATTIAVIFIKRDYGGIPNDSVIIDVGANIGVFSIFSAGKGNVVYSYEPMPDNFHLLEENIKLNKLENRVFAFNLGVAAKREKRKLYLGKSPFHSFLPVGSSPFNVLHNDREGVSKQSFLEVDCISLKDIFDENQISECDILKIDCEGAEYEILYNLPDSYFNRIKEIRMEYHNHLNQYKNNGEYLKSFLANRGFSIEKFKKGSPYQGDVWFKRVD